MRILKQAGFIFFFSVAWLCCEKEFTLNFNNVDIRTFIKFVSEFTGENYVLDPNVRGNITVYSQKAVPVKDIDKIFKTILNLYGYTTVQKPGISEIVPLPDAKVRSGEINLGKIPEALYPAFVNQIVPLKYYPASSLPQMLSPYLSKGGQITVDERSNSLIISDTGLNVAKLMEILDKIDIPSPPGKEEFRVYRLENANSEDIAKTLNEILSKKKVATVVPARGTKTSGPIQPSVVSAKATNSLIVYADPEDFPTIDTLVKELDVMTKQVLIEALIAEVSYDKEKEIGIEWSVADAFAKDRFTGTAETKFDLEKTIPLGAKIAVAKGITDIGGLIRLYGKDSRFNILSTPQIVTADNQEASINVSENRPYLKEVRFLGTVTGYSDTDTIKSYDYKDVGIVLKLTPQISQDKYVKLKIHQEVTKVLDAGADGQLTTAKREADTTLIVPNNQTVVLGGLIRNDTEKVVEKVPFLGDLWIIGPLFRRTRDASMKTNLLIFITPRIITSFEDAEKIRQEKEKLIQDIKK